MFARSAILRALRPREIMFTPPPLVKRPGNFKCKICDNRWTSDNVWITRTTQRCYQGETCDKCGTTNKPYYIGHVQETMFNRIKNPHPVKPGASTSRAMRRVKHVAYMSRVKRTK